MAPRTDFPPVRACLFDMDALLLDTEDLYTLCINIVLERYGRPSLPWSVNETNAIFDAWARLPISRDQYITEFAGLQRENFPTAQPPPGVVRLLAELGRTRYWDLVREGKTGAVASAASTTDTEEGGGGAGVAGAVPGRRVHLALATSHKANFSLKTPHLSSLFSIFPSARRVLGDVRIPPGRGKPMPDIYAPALATINSTLPASERPIAPDECLVLEDSMPGVVAGRRSGMRVVWVPHAGLAAEYARREPTVLAGRIGEAGESVDGHTFGEVGDGWAECLPSLEAFPYALYGIVVPPLEVEGEPCMLAAARDVNGEVQVAEPVGAGVNA